MGALQVARGKPPAAQSRPNVNVIPYSEAVRLGIVRPVYGVQPSPSIQAPLPQQSPQSIYRPSYQIRPQTISSLYPQAPFISQAYPPYPSYQVPYSSNVYTQQIFGSYQLGRRRQCLSSDLARLATLTGLSESRILNLYREFLMESDNSPVITRCQFRYIVYTLLPSMNPSHIRLISDMLFDQVDRDKNGVIDFWEYVSYYRQVFADEIEVQRRFSASSSFSNPTYPSQLFSSLPFYGNRSLPLTF